jgi:glycosyltransferase involved in cell wall biosynthesis
MQGGGAQRAMVRLAGGFADAGYQVEVLTLEPEGSFRSELSPSVKLTRLGSKRIFGAIPALARYMRRERPDVMMVTEPACNIAVIAAKLLSGGQTRVLIREGLFPSVAVRESPHKATRLAYKLAPYLYRHADVIVAVAGDMAADLARFARLERNRVTTIAVNPVVTTTLTEAAAIKPEHPWFSGDIPVVVGVGRLDRQKDFLTLLKAFERVRQARSCRLVIVGEGPLRGALETARGTSAYPEDIDLPGFVAKPFSYMSHADVFVLSSRYEGLPNALIEALACGAPVVSADCPSGPREILDNGRFGRLTPVGDDKAMADAILATLDHPVDRQISKARGFDFTIGNSTALYVKALFPTPHVS